VRSQHCNICPRVSSSQRKFSGLSLCTNQFILLERLTSRSTCTLTVTVNHWQAHGFTDKSSSPLS
jgi:hypothetical protein